MAILKENVSCTHIFEQVFVIGWINNVLTMIMFLLRYFYIVSIFSCEINDNIVTNKLQERNETKKIKNCAALWRKLV